MPAEPHVNRVLLPPIPPFRAAERGLGATLRHLNRAYARRLGERLAAHGLTVGAYLHLRALWEAPGLPQTDLARRLGIEKASSTAVLDGLVAAGLVERRPHPRDARKRRLELSADGLALMAVVLPDARQVALAACAGMDEAEQAVLFRLLDRMIANLEAQDGTTRPG